MDKTEKLIDWKEDERKDRNRDGIDDDLEPPIPDVSAGSGSCGTRKIGAAPSDPYKFGSWAPPVALRTASRT